MPNTNTAAALPPAPSDDGLEQALVSLNPDTGEELPPPTEADVPAWQRDVTYDGIAELQLTDEQIAALLDPVSDDEIDIKPDSFGAVYLSHIGYRRRLNKAFKPGGWSQRQISAWRYDPDTKILNAEFALYARGADGRVCYVSKAIGGQQYYGGQGDSKMSYDDAAQGAESNALMRCCKQLGVALELWEKRTATAIRQRLGVLVLVRKANGDVKPAWRRVDDQPLPYEQGLATDSPNADKYRGAKPTHTVPTPVSSATSQATAAARPQPAPQPTVTDDDPWGKNGIITLPQAKRLYAIVKKSGMDDHAVALHMKQRYGYRSSKQITKANYAAICAWVEGGSDH